VTIAELIEEFDLIEDEELRRRCVSVWDRALSEHGLAPSALENMPFCSDVPSDVVSMASHIRAVARTAAHLADLFEELYGIRIERDVLVAAALLHDVGKLDEGKEPILEHSLSSVLRAKDAGVGDGVLHAIAFHSEAGASKRRSIEAELLYFADFVHYRPLLVGKIFKKNLDL